MEVPYRQDALRALLDPCLLRRTLAFRTVSIATRIVRRLRKAAGVAGVEMATEGGSAARVDRAQHLGLIGCERVQAPIRCAEVSDDVRDLEDAASGGRVRRAEHGCALSRRAFRLRQPIEGADRFREQRGR